MDLTEMHDSSSSTNSDSDSDSLLAHPSDGLLVPVNSQSDSLPEVDIDQDWQSLSLTPSTVSLNDYDWVSDEDIPCSRKTYLKEDAKGQQQQAEPDTISKPTVSRKRTPGFERGPPLCEANMFGPLDWGLELMGGVPEHPEDTAKLFCSRSMLERSAQLHETNIFDPLNESVELMDAHPEPKREAAETPSSPCSPIIEEVSYNGVVIYTICRGWR